MITARPPNTVDFMGGRAYAGVGSSLAEAIVIHTEPDPTKRSGSAWREANGPQSCPGGVVLN